MISIVARPENSPRTVARDLGMYQEYLGRLTFGCVRHEAAMAALGFVRFTPPFLIRKGGEKGTSGLGKEDESVGKEAVAKDIRSIFKPTDSDLAGAVDPIYGSLAAFVAWRKKPYPSMGSPILRAIRSDADVQRAFGKARNLMSGRPSARLLEGQAVMRSIHDAERRKFKGRITRNRGPSSDIRKSPWLAEQLTLQKYIQARQAQVGWMKAAWAHVIRSIGTVILNGKSFRPAGGTYIGRWITRHGSGGGGNVVNDFNRKRVRIVNNVGDNDEVSTTADVVRAVVNWRNICLNSNPIYQREVDRSIRLWNAGRIRAFYTK